MSEWYTVDTADTMGEPWTPNAPGAKPLQGFWCQFQGVDRPVMINKQVGNVVRPGDQVFGDLTHATSQKGNPYYKFKSQKADSPRPNPTPAAAPAVAGGGYASGEVPGWFVPYGNMIRKLYDQATQGTKQDSEPMPRQVVDDAALGGETAFGYDRGESLSPEKKAELEDVFGGGMFEDEDEAGRPD